MVATNKQMLLELISAELDACLAPANPHPVMPVRDWLNAPPIAVPDTTAVAPPVVIGWLNIRLHNRLSAPSAANCKSVGDQIAKAASQQSGAVVTPGPIGVDGVVVNG